MNMNSLIVLPDTKYTFEYTREASKRFIGLTFIKLSIFYSLWSKKTYYLNALKENTALNYFEYIHIVCGNLISARILLLRRVEKNFWNFF